MFDKCALSRGKNSIIVVISLNKLCNIQMVNWVVVATEQQKVTINNITSKDVMTTVKKKKKQSKK